MNIEYIYLSFLLLGSVIYDYRYRKIPNKITIPSMLIGILWSTVNSGLEGFLFSIMGFLVGFAVFLIPYSMGGMGAGDVKLMAAIGTFLGWELTFLSSIMTALSGGFLVILYVLIKGGMKRTFIDAFGLIAIPTLKILYYTTGREVFLKKQSYYTLHKKEKEKTYIPYAFAIMSGTMSALLMEYYEILQI